MAPDRSGVSIFAIFLANFQYTVVFKFPLAHRFFLHDIVLNVQHRVVLDEVGALFVVVVRHNEQLIWRLQHHLRRSVVNLKRAGGLPVRGHLRDGVDQGLRGATQEVKVLLAEVGVAQAVAVGVVAPTHVATLER